MEENTLTSPDGAWKKNLALFLTAQGVTLIGSSLVTFSIVWYVTLSTKSGSMMSMFTVASMLPMFFVSPFGGVWADRYDRKLLINLADGFIAVVTLAIAFFFMFGVESLALLLVCSGVRSAAQGVQMPAIGAIIPQIVPQEHLVRANGIYASIQSLSMLATPALAGVLMTFAPLQTVLFIDVATAACGILILACLVKVPRHVRGGASAGSAGEPANSEGMPASSNIAATNSDGISASNNMAATNNEGMPTSSNMAATNSEDMPASSAGEPSSGGGQYIRELIEGISYIKRHDFMLRYFVFLSFFFILLTPAALLTPLQVTRDFGGEVWQLSAIEIAFAGGMSVGGIIIGVWGGFKNKMITISVGLILFGLEAIGLGLFTNFTPYLICMAVMGLTVPLANTPGTAVMQTKTDPEYMGRVFSVITMISSVLMPLGMVFFGPLSDAVSIDTLLIITGAATIILALLIRADKKLMAAGA